MRYNLVSAALALALPTMAAADSSLPALIQPCWNYGTLSATALEVVVAVSFTVNAKGALEPETIQMTGHTGSEEAANQAFEAARLAILQCSLASGSLPVASQNVTLQFGPDRSGEMRIIALPSLQPYTTEANAVGKDPVNKSPHLR